MTITVGELRKSLEGVPDDLEVTVRAGDDNTDESICAPVIHAGVEIECGDEERSFFAIDAIVEINDNDHSHDVGGEGGQ